MGNIDRAAELSKQRAIADARIEKLTKISDRRESIFKSTEGLEDKLTKAYVSGGISTSTYERLEKALEATREGLCTIAGASNNKREELSRQVFIEERKHTNLWEALTLADNGDDQVTQSELIDAGISSNLNEIMTNGISGSDRAKLAEKHMDQNRDGEIDYTEINNLIGYVSVTSRDYISSIANTMSDKVIPASKIGEIASNRFKDLPPDTIHDNDPANHTAFTKIKEAHEAFAYDLINYLSVPANLLPKEVKPAEEALGK